MRPSNGRKFLTTLNSLSAAVDKDTRVRVFQKPFPSVCGMKYEPLCRLKRDRKTFLCVARIYSIGENLIVIK